ncbi:GrBNV gp94-like protein [Tomelloso virus]|uniref:GrBNV gp94-like protein n=1 Tax=Tomelloso virus TaxID=2053981 RepID=A0A2H4T2V1_9VIRU|nr:GrBNV gp94-like protein [Tomelloso virus]ATY70252.1 GrBNV gp94-like protein [Tomelloso virus]
MDMTFPRSKPIGIHVCVLKESQPSSNFLTPPTRWPLLFTHSTEIFKIAQKTGETPNINNVSKCSVLSETTIWQVDELPERTFDFKQHCPSDDAVFCNSLINSIVDLIQKYKVVYFINLPFHYFGIFERINHVFHERFGDLGHQ